VAGDKGVSDRFAEGTPTDSTEGPESSRQRPRTNEWAESVRLQMRTLERKEIGSIEVGLGMDRENLRTEWR